MVILQNNLKFKQSTLKYFGGLSIVGCLNKGAQLITKKHNQYLLVWEKNPMVVSLKLGSKGLVFFKNTTYFSLLNQFAEQFRTSNQNQLIYTNTSLIKNIGVNSLQKFVILFLRKNKIFNKGRYSRNRQFYRTGVYWCLYLSIVLFTGLYYWFFHFMVNFGFLWWLFFLGLVSFVLPKTLKFRLYNIRELYRSFVGNLWWVYTCAHSGLGTLRMYNQTLTQKTFNYFFLKNKFIPLVYNGTLSMNLN